MPLTAPQRSIMQTVYNAVVGKLQAQYGASLVSIAAVRFVLDGGGQITQMIVHTIVEATDAAGDKVQRRKEIDIW